MWYMVTHENVVEGHSIDLLTGGLPAFAIVEALAGNTTVITSVEPEMDAL